MAGAEVNEIFNCSPDEFFAIISDYENYSSFLSEVKKVTLIEDRGIEKLVEFEVSVLKTFKYRLLIKEDRPNGISWTFDSGDLFKKSDGYWELSPKGDKVMAKYSIDAKFKVFVPGPVSKALVNVNLPNMIASYKKRVSEVYGK